jgi:hypothetical protein
VLCAWSVLKPGEADAILVNIFVAKAKEFKKKPATTD